MVLLFYRNPTGYSAVWLAYLFWEQVVVGSNPTIPIEYQSMKILNKN